MNSFWVWATEHWFLGFCLMFTLLEGAIRLVSRSIRLTMVLTRGWPKAPNMDADGDIVLPEMKR